MSSTVKVAAAQGCLGYEINGRTYDTDRSGHITLPTRDAKTLVQDGGAFIPGINFARAQRRWRCERCGFAPVFPRCKCGHDAIEES